MLSRVVRFGYQPMIKFPRRHQAPRVKITTRDALNTAMIEEMERDDKVFLMGEEVAQYDGAYKVSKGLLSRFGRERVVDTPITETAMTGVACGSAMYGLKPILEFMTWNFALQGLDHIYNSCAKLNYMSGGEISGGSVVFRGLNGPAAAVAAQHSQCFASVFSNVPGLIVISPYDSEDCRGLLKSAIRSENPVAFLENENLYSESFEVDEDVMDKEFIIPIGKAKVMRQGTDVTLVGYSRNVLYSMEAAAQLQKEGISCEVVNLRTIRPMDRDTIVESVIKTGRLVTVEDGFPQSGIGAEIIALINETPAFDYLRGPVQRVSSWDVPMPYSKPMEDQVPPGADTVIAAVRKVMQYD